MRSFRCLSASLLLAGAAHLALPVAVCAQEVVQPLPGSTDADRLADAIRRLGANPKDLSALVEAGELSIKVGDTTAAAALFKRAEAIDARNARVKAGIARILVNGEHPGEALRYFDLAQQYGLQPAAFADDRGLAYDLIGQQDRAQRDYRLSLRTQDNDEVRRRYALSLGISGHKDEALAEIDTLLRKSDRGAWRARAFILAMNGDAAGASKIASGMMPPGMASGLAAFFTRLPTLNPADRAFAVHFGEVTPTPSRLADARMIPPLPTLGPDPYAPRTKPVQVAAAPKESAGDRRRREREEKRAQQLAAREAVKAQKAAEKAAKAQAKTPPVAIASAATTPKPTPSRSATPVPTRPTTTTTPTTPAPTTPAPTTPAPTTTATTTTGPAATALAANTTRPPVPAAIATPIVQQPDRQPTTSSVRVTAIPTPAAAPLVPPVSAGRVPSADSGASLPVREASGVQTVPLPASRPAPVSAPQSTQTASTPVPTQTAPARTTTPVRSTPTQVAAATSTPRPAPIAEKPPHMVDDSILARIVANISIPASELGVAPPPSHTPVAAGSSQTLDEAAALAERSAAAEEARKQRAAEKRAAADAKAAAAKKAADAKALADKKAAAAKAAEEKKAARAEPARVWVQVAGGANEGDLEKAWKSAQGKSASLAARKGYSTPLRATNRVVTGPFKTQKEAQDFVNKLRGEGISAFTFTSTAGQKVSRLGAGK